MCVLERWGMIIFICGDYRCESLCIQEIICFKIRYRYEEYILNIAE